MAARNGTLFYLAAGLSLSLLVFVLMHGGMIVMNQSSLEAGYLCPPNRNPFNHRTANPNGWFSSINFGANWRDVMGNSKKHWFLPWSEEGPACDGFNWTVRKV